MGKSAILLPSDVSSRVGFFDRFAGRTAKMASRAPFFALCLLLVVLWLIQGAVLVFTGGVHRFLAPAYQLEINTTTTIVTFLMVALLQNSQTRSGQAVQHKLNAIAEALADLMKHTADQHDDPSLHDDLAELRAAVGLEDREGTSGDTQS
jgi:low affinity Fe/Cu permease